MLARLTFLLALSSLAAQTDPPQETPVFRTEVNLVEVDVHVLDGDGNFVDDLKPTDFEIFEDGVPQTVATFRLVDLPMVARPFSEPGVPPVASDVITNEGAAEGLVYALVLDDLHTAPERTPLVRQVARQFVEQWLGKEDLATVSMTSGAADTSSYFTSNRQALLEAVNKFNGRKLRSRTLEIIELRDELLMDMLTPQSVKAQLRGIDEQHAFRATTALSHLRAMSDVLRDIEGRRKVILYIGDGIPYDIDIIKAESVGTVALLDIRQAVASTGLSNVSIYTLDVRGLETGQEELASVSRTATAGTLQTLGLGEGEDRLDPDILRLLDTVGREGLEFTEEVRRSHDTLRMLAAETGGLAAVNQNDLEQGLHDLIADNRRFYKLGYYPPSVTADGRFRTIEVRIKGKNLNVRARKGYIVPGEETDIAEAAGLDAPLERELLSRPAPITDLPLRVTAFPFRLSEENYSVGVIVECDIHPFRFTEEGGQYRDEVTLSAIVLDEKGTWVTGQKSQFDLALQPPAREQMLRDGFRALSILDVPPGSHQLRVGVWEEGAEQKGSVYYDLTLPSAAESELVMGGVLLSSKLEESVPVASTTEARQAVPFLPSTRREFTQRDQVLAGVQIFQDPALSKDQEVVLDTSVRDEQGNTVFEISESPAIPSGAPWIARSQIDLSGFSPGQYIVEAQARDPNGVSYGCKRNVFHVIDSPSTADLPLSTNYIDLLRSYSSGHFKEVRNQLASWADDRIKKEAGQLRSSTVDPKTLQAAVLLHTELSAFNAWGLSAETRALHLQVAEAFVALIPGEKAFVRGWFLTVAYIYQGSNPSVSLHYLKEARQQFPDDAEILFATGVTYETLAAVDRDRDVLEDAEKFYRRTGTSYETMVAVGKDSGELKDAEKFYRRSIEVDSGLAEAHLRLGKVLQERGGDRTEEANRELEWVATNASDPHLLFLANLFLGDHHMSRDKFVAAVAFYRAAVDSEPRWQTAYIALSHALRASGERSAARDVMQKALRLPVHDPSYVDGYRLYALGQLGKVPQMLDELRRGITK